MIIAMWGLIVTALLVIGSLPLMSQLSARPGNKAQASLIYFRNAV
jgi:hypothetical protein